MELLLELFGTGPIIMRDKNLRGGLCSHCEPCEGRGPISLGPFHTQCSIQTIIFSNKYLIT